MIGETHLRSADGSECTNCHQAWPCPSARQALDKVRGELQAALRRQRANHPNNEPPSAATWFYEDQPGQALGQLEDVIGAPLPDQLREGIQAALDDKRQVLLRVSSGDIFRSPTQCQRPNILVLDP